MQPIFQGVFLFGKELHWRFQSMNGEFSMAPLPGFS